MRKASPLLAALVLAGCVRLASPPPPDQWFALGDLRAPLRDYGANGSTPCDADPMAVVAELEQMNGLLSEFLQRTDARQLSNDTSGLLLVMAQRELPPALEKYTALTTSVSACGFPEGYRAGATSAQALELVERSRKRVEEAPRLLALAKRQRAADAWRRSESAARVSERAIWCPPDVKVADVYYAWEDVSGATEYYFCDGSKVVATVEGELTHVPSPDAPRTRSAQTPAGYLKAAKRYPASEIRRPPDELRAGATPP